MKYLNATHAEHFLITLLVTFVLWLLMLPALMAVPELIDRSYILFLGVVLTGLPVVGAFIGREIAQHSYKLALKRNWKWGEVMPVKWYEGITTGWSPDSVLDVVSSVAAYALLLFLGYLTFLY